MNLRIPGLELREPLRAHPFFGTLLGGLVGALLGYLGRNAFGAPPSSVFRGYLLGGLLAGFLGGVAIPLFRSRLLAGAIVSAVLCLALAVAAPYWGEAWGLGEIVFLGVTSGFTYAVLLWDYHPQDPPQAE